MIEFFTEPMHYQFFRHGLLAATLVGALCGLMGVYIVLRRMSYIGHGLSHAVFGGAVVSYIIGINFYIGAGLWGFVSALLINATARRRKIGADAAIGVITTASFALGVALISKQRSFTRNFEAALFGNILGVDMQDLYVIGAVTAVVVLGIFFFYKQLLFVTFDYDLSQVYGVKTSWIDAGFALALAATVVASLNVVGVTLIAASIVVPPVTARLLTDSFGKMLILSTLIGMSGGIFGMFFSYEWDVASGAAIVLFLTAVFLVVFTGTSLHRLWLDRAPETDTSRRHAVPAMRPATSAVEDHHFD